jgi:hypothetical protein
MLKGYSLFKAYGMSQFGIDPIVIGINAKRLDVPISYWMDNYTAAYGEEYFAGLKFGYENAYNEDVIKDLIPVNIAELDISYVFKNLTNNRDVRDYSFGEVKLSEKNDGGVYITFTTKCTHRVYPITFTIEYHRNISADSSHWSHWHIDGTLEHRIGIQRFSHGRRYTVDDIHWDENNYHQGGCDSTFRASYSYERFERGEKGVPHSGNVAKLIFQVTEYYLQRYRLIEVPKPDIATMADSARIKILTPCKGDNIDSSISNFANSARIKHIGKEKQNA